MIVLVRAQIPCSSALRSLPRKQVLLSLVRNLPVRARVLLSFVSRAFLDLKVRVMAERIQMADHLRELNRRAMSEVDAASSKAAWAEWEAIPIGLRLRWHARRRFLIEWTADLLFVVERAILGRVFTGWHVVKLTADLQAERAAAAGLEDSSTEDDSSTCASDADADGDAS